MDETKTICMLPWTSMEVTPMGTYRPCCLYAETIPDLSVKDGHTIRDAQSSQYMMDLRSSFLRGEKPRGCDMCWQEEKVQGRVSKRIATFAKMKGVSPTYDEQSISAKFLDLKLGNICNLKCRICGSWSSSKWAQEEIQTSGGENDMARNHLSSGQWPRQNPYWWDALEGIMHQIDYLEFTGGEPFLIEEHFELLESLITQGHAHRIDIHYNTNGTQWPEHALAIWKNFKRVEVAFSIDDTGKRFEYQRYGSDWRSIEENVKAAVRATSANPKLHLQICTTFNVLNSYYWPETERWINDIGITDIHYNILQGPAEFNLRNLTSLAKQAYRNRMEQARDHKISNVIGFMELPGEDMSRKLLARIAKNDAYRKQHLSEYHRDVWDILNA